MTGTLAETLTPEKRSLLISDCVDLVDSEVKSKSGMSGIAIKGAYGAVKKIKPGFVKTVIDSLLDKWLEKLEPHHKSWGGSGSFGDYVSKHEDAVAEDLLAVTDERAEKSDNRTVG